ncbi:hypothetical protein SFUMM280S_05825 [Streptomyces fumanus]
MADASGRMRVRRSGSVRRPPSPTRPPLPGWRPWPVRFHRPPRCPSRGSPACRASADDPGHPARAPRAQRVPRRSALRRSARRQHPTAASPHRAAPLRSPRSVSSAALSRADIDEAGELFPQPLRLPVAAPLPRLRRGRVPGQAAAAGQRGLRGDRHQPCASTGQLRAGAPSSTRSPTTRPTSSSPPSSDWNGPRRTRSRSTGSSSSAEDFRSRSARSAPGCADCRTGRSAGSPSGSRCPSRRLEECSLPGLDLRASYQAGFWRLEERDRLAVQLLAAWSDGSFTAEQAAAQLRLDLMTAEGLLARLAERHLLPDHQQQGRPAGLFRPRTGPGLRAATAGRN